MNRKPIAIQNLKVRPHHLWAEQWMLLTCGDFKEGRFNTMTVSWGSMGTMWDMPFAQVVLRPGRYTREFMEWYDTFTLCAFGERHRAAIELLGSQSGENGDKIAASKLTPAASSVVAAPCFAEAELVVECRKIYWQDMNPANFKDRTIDRNYPGSDYHRIYFGEIVAASGIDAYGA